MLLPKRPVWRSLLCEQKIKLLENLTRERQSFCLSVLWLFKDENFQPVPYNPVSVATEVGRCPFWLLRGPFMGPGDVLVSSQCFFLPFLRTSRSSLFFFFFKQTVRSVTISLLIEGTYHSLYFAPPLTSSYADSAKLKSCDIWKGMKLEAFQNSISYYHGSDFVVPLSYKGHRGAGSAVPGDQK